MEIVEDRVYLHALRDGGLDGVGEADELLMAMAGHVAADDRAVEHVERGEQRGGAVALVVVGHGAEPPLLHRQAGLGAVEHSRLRPDRQGYRRRGRLPRHRGQAGRAHSQRDELYARQRWHLHATTPMTKDHAEGAPGASSLTVSQTTALKAGPTRDRPSP